MPEYEYSLYLIPILFFVAFLYSSVGLGGGSSYTAILAIFSINYLAIPTISLTLNLFVTSISAVTFIINRHVRLNLLLPFLLASMPLAYLGGSLHLQKDIFLWILWASLIFVVIRIYFVKQINLKLEIKPRQKLVISITAGMLLGFIAGVVGIGGGIYLIPLILVLGLGSAKQAAACGAIFVWVNSAIGLSARLVHQPINLLDYLPLIIAVVIGGLLGSYLGASRYSAKTVEKTLGLVIIIAVVLLGKRLFTEL
ncbi:MAG: sulfite exporter TauE/SafE family protein [Thioalkalispiraceae bacterium]|jgi:uncharacterized membrane protein YfcA